MPQHRMTTDEFKEKVYKKFENKVEILSEYKGGTKPIVILYHCDKHGNSKISINAKNIFSKSFQPCQECQHELRIIKGKNARSKDKNYHYKKLKQKIENKGGKLLTKEWTTAKSKYKIKCNKGHIFITTADCINSKNQWCPYCYGRKGNFEERIKKIIKDKNGELLTKYIKSNTYVKVKCNKHNYVWDIMPMNLKKGRWCPVCSLPYSEKTVYDYLHNNKYNFKIQYTFNDLKSSNNELLRFDFAVLNKDNTVKYLIEVDDEEHRQHHTQLKRVYAKKRDELKNKYCKINNIILFRLTFKHNNTYKNEAWYYNYIKDNIKKYDNYILQKQNRGVLHGIG